MIWVESAEKILMRYFCPCRKNKMGKSLLSFALFQSTCIPAAKGFASAVLESLPSEGGGLNLTHMRGMLTQSQIQVFSLRIAQIAFTPFHRRKWRQISRRRRVVCRMKPVFVHLSKKCRRRRNPGRKISRPALNQLSHGDTTCT